MVGAVGCLWERSAAAMAESTGQLPCYSQDVSHMAPHGPGQK